MQFFQPFTEEDIRRAERVPITSLLMANATFEGIRAAFNYWVFHLRGVLQGLLNPTSRERAIMTPLYRAIGYVASIRRLNSAMYVQSGDWLSQAVCHQRKWFDPIKPSNQIWCPTATSKLAADSSQVLSRQLVEL